MPIVAGIPTLADQENLVSLFLFSKCVYIRKFDSLIYQFSDKKPMFFLYFLPQNLNMCIVNRGVFQFFHYSIISEKPV